MKILNIPTNVDALKVIDAHNEEVDFVLKAFLRSFAEADRQVFICLYGQIEFEFLKN